MTHKPKETLDEVWFDNIVQTYQSRLINYAARILNQDVERAKDATQEAFIKLYNTDWSTIADYIAPWLYRVVRNQALNMKRKEKRMIPQEVPETLPAQNEASQQQKKAADSLLDMIHHLTPPKGELVMLKFKDGFSYKEIASITGLSVSNVGYQLHHAIRELKSKWEAQNATNG